MKKILNTLLILSIIFAFILLFNTALNASRGHNEKLLVSKMQNESKKEESANKKL